MLRAGESISVLTILRAAPGIQSILEPTTALESLAVLAIANIAYIVGSFDVTISYLLAAVVEDFLGTFISRTLDTTLVALIVSTQDRLLGILHVVVVVAMVASIAAVSSITTMSITFIIIGRRVSAPATVAVVPVASVTIRIYIMIKVRTKDLR